MNATERVETIMALVEHYPSVGFFDMADGVERVLGLLAKCGLTYGSVGPPGFHELLQAELGI